MLFGKGDDIHRDKITFLHNRFKDIIKAFQGKEGDDNNGAKKMNEGSLSGKLPLRTGSV